MAIIHPIGSNVPFANTLMVLPVVTILTDFQGRKIPTKHTIDATKPIGPSLLTLKSFAIAIIWWIDY
jgi:hypothetical protein